MSSSAPLLTSAETKPARPPSSRFHPLEKKRRIVEESLLPNASVARVARAHGVNANQVFYWRQQYQQGLHGPAPSNPALWPVQVADPILPEPTPVPHGKSKAVLSTLPREETALTGTIHLELSKAKLWIQGTTDPACLRVILDYLLR